LRPRPRPGLTLDRVNGGYTEDVYLRSASRQVKGKLSASRPGIASGGGLSKTALALKVEKS